MLKFFPYSYTSLLGKDQSPWKNYKACRIWLLHVSPASFYCSAHHFLIPSLWTSDLVQILENAMFFLTCTSPGICPVASKSPCPLYLVNSTHPPPLIPHLSSLMKSSLVLQMNFRSSLTVVHVPCILSCFVIQYVLMIK